MYTPRRTTKRLSHHRGGPVLLGQDTSLERQRGRRSITQRSTHAQRTAPHDIATDSLPSDHCALGVTLALAAPRTPEQTHRKSTPESIGWVLREANETEWPMPMHQYEQNEYRIVLCESRHLGGPAIPGRTKATRSHTADEMLIQDDEARRHLRHEPHTKRRKIRQERERRHFDYILTHLRPGGWGKFAMTRRRPVQGLTRLGTVEGHTTKNADILIDYFLAILWDSWDFAICSVTDEHIAQALRSSPARSTGGASGVVTEMWWRGNEAALSHWAWSCNHAFEEGDSQREEICCLAKAI